MIKLLVFDWDDVFTLGAKEGYIDCLHSTLVTLKIRLDPDEESRRIQLAWGKSHQEELKILLSDHPDLLERAYTIYEDKFFGGEFVEALRYVPGANQTLVELAKKYTLAIATGAHPDLLRKQMIPKFQVPDVFSQIISSYEVDDPAKQKPHPFILQEIMKTQHYQPAETLFIGDAEADVLMARRAGVEPVVVLTGNLDQAQAKQLKVKYIIEDVTHLKNLLDDEVD